MALQVKLFGGVDIEDRSGSVPLLIRSGTTLLVYSDATGIDELTTFSNGDSALQYPLRVTRDSKVPLFFLGSPEAPDNSKDVIYVRIGNAPLQPLWAQTSVVDGGTP